MVAASLRTEHSILWRLAAIGAAAALLLIAASPVAAKNPNGKNIYAVQVLQSNATDPDLVNGWGITAGPPGLTTATPWWVSDNGTNKSTLYTGAGAKLGLIVGVPGGPTGTVFNVGLRGFTVTGSGGSGSSRFLFATEGGQVLGWASPTATPSAVPGFTAGDGAIYKSLAIADDANGLHLFVADFHNAKVDVLDDSFTPVTLAGSFVDPRIPKGYAPFGIQNLNGHIFVTYAKQDAVARDEIAGGGKGFVSMFGTDGTFQGRVFSHGMLNAPWGLAWAPSNFGKFSGDLLVGNFGNGRINAFARTSHGWVPRGPMKGSNHRPIRIDGLWGIGFGNDGAAGPANVLYFAAGPEDETEGLFGSISAPAD
jgi:uncharacterized protein (TIGR03118 family)